MPNSSTKSSKVIIEYNNLGYAIVQRIQSAMITVNQSLKVVQNSLASKYKDEQEKEEIKSI